MKRQRARAAASPRVRSRTQTASRRSADIEELRRRLAVAEAELQFYRNKHEWLQAALATQRHARQMLEASFSGSYQDTVARIRDVVRSVIPAEATVLVVSKGDEELLDLDGRRAWHFPQNEDGGYAGYYPADSPAAIAHLQSLINKGAEYLLLPNTAFWWLEYYRGLDEWLAGFQTPVWRDERCAIYELSRDNQTLRPRAPATHSEPAAGLNEGAEGRTVRSQQETSPVVICFPIIDWDFRFQRPQQLMLQFARAGHRVFYLSHEFRKKGEPYVLRLLEESLWEVSLRGPRFNPRQGLLDDAHSEVLASSLSVLRRSLCPGAAMAIVQSPFWWPLLKRIAPEFDWPVVYDCMDYHAGFSTSNPLLVEQERELLAFANLVVASSSLLELAARRFNRNVVLVRNGCDYEHFAKVSPRPGGCRPAVGYYGAISDWFDSDLVADLAQQQPDWDFVLVGSTLSADVSRLSRLPNVTFTGERPYSEIPEWLAKFDVAVLPFKRTPLTEAANPVKAYEIFAAGKPLVSVPLPEMRALEPLVRLASTANEFQQQIQAELSARDGVLAGQRRLFAKANTWQKRFESLLPAVTAASRRPPSSTKTCLRLKGSCAQP